MRSFRIVLCPCVWCCCPGLLVLWLLASNVDPSVAREHWLDMFSFVTGLAGVPCGNHRLHAIDVHATG